MKNLFLAVVFIPYWLVNTDLPLPDACACNGKVPGMYCPAFVTQCVEQVQPAPAKIYPTSH